MAGTFRYKHMNKVLTVTLLIILGLIAAGGLVIGAMLELLEAIIGFVFWSVIILIGYFFIKSKT